MTTDTHATVRAQPIEALPHPHRRAEDQPHASALGVAYDYVVDHELRIGFAEVDAICRRYAAALKAFGGSL